MAKRKHGGRREGAGRKPIDGGITARVTINLTATEARNLDRNSGERTPMEAIKHASRKLFLDGK